MLERWLTWLNFDLVDMMGRESEVIRMKAEALVVLVEDGSEPVELLIRHQRMSSSNMVINDLFAKLRIPWAVT